MSHDLPLRWLLWTVAPPPDTHKFIDDAKRCREAAGSFQKIAQSQVRRHHVGVRNLIQALPQEGTVPGHRKLRVVALHVERFQEEKRRPILSLLRRPRLGDELNYFRF